jgi:maleylpyruvate isomerase
MADETPHEPPPGPTETEILYEATQRLVRDVDALDEAAWSEPSGLPGWTRAHVVAHLTLNAEALAGALSGIVEDEPTPMYRTPESRDSDIEELATVEPAELRARLLGATTQFADAVASVPDDAWSASIERVPGGRRFHARSTVGMRLREVEIHHVDLGIGYTTADWEPAFGALLLDAMGKRDPAAQPFRAHATDVDRTWAFGDGGPTVTGTAGDLGWWLTGRGNGGGLTCDSGELPEVAAW